MVRHRQPAGQDGGNLDLAPGDAVADTDGASIDAAETVDDVVDLDGPPTVDIPSDHIGSDGEVLDADGGSPDADAVGDVASEVTDAAPTDTGGDVAAEVADAETVDAGPPPVATEIWMRMFGSAGPEEVKAVTADSFGNVYVAGYFQEALTIGSETFTPSQPGAMAPDSFVASYDPWGGFRWAHAFGADGADIPYEIAVDGQDNVYVAGSHQQDLTVGPDVLLSKGSQDLYVVSYDANGKQLWAKNWGGPYGESPRDLSVNVDGDIFITGSYTGSIHADGIVVDSTYEFGGLSEIFVLAVDGQTQDAMWIRTFDGYGHDVGTALVADEIRNAVIAVSFQQNLDIDVGAGIVFESGGDNFDVGLVRLDEEGNVLWANAYGGPGSEEIIGLDMDDLGHIYATGVFSDTAFFGGGNLVGTAGHDIMVAGYTGAGEHLWSVGYTGGSFDQALDLEVAGNGIYIAGRFKEDLTFGTFALDAIGDDYDIFVSRFHTANGDAVWAESVGSTEGDQGNGIGIGGDGGIYVGGYVGGDVSFAGVTNAKPGTGIDALVFRLDD